MNVLHLCANNLTPWINITKDLSVSLNANQNPLKLRDTLYYFNALDTLGLIVYPSLWTSTYFELIDDFDSMFLENGPPVIIIGDNIPTLTLKNCSLYYLQSKSNTISDTDLKSLFVLLYSIADLIYPKE